jgi:hypothetical protein
MVHPENEYYFKHRYLFWFNRLSCLWDLFFDSEPPGLASPLPVPLDFARGQGVP